MANPYPAEIASDIREALARRAAKGGTGNVTIVIDGVSTSFSEKEARDALIFWEARAARASGSRKLISTLDLRQAF